MAPRRLRSDKNLLRTAQDLLGSAQDLLGPVKEIPDCCNKTMFSSERWEIVGKPALPDQELGYIHRARSAVP